MTGTCEKPWKLRLVPRADSVAAVKGFVALIDIIVMMPCLQPGQAALGNSWGFERVRGGRPNSSCGTENNDIPELQILAAHTLKQDSPPGGQPGFSAVPRPSLSQDFRTKPSPLLAFAQGNFNNNGDSGTEEFGGGRG